MTELEHHHTPPLEHVMTTLGLSDFETAQVMGVSPQTIAEWQNDEPPMESAAKIGVIADILLPRLRDGMLPVVARRPAVAYGGRTMLDVITDDEHEWLRQDVRDSFNSEYVA